MMTLQEKLQREGNRLAGPDSFAYWLSLYRPQKEVFEAIGLYGQMAATIDLHLRRIYFALHAEGANERGPERAHLDQIIERLPEAVQSSELALYRKEQFPELIAAIQGLLTMRNDVIHSSCRWQPDGEFLIFAHANEKAGRDIRTGEGIAFWLIPHGQFQEIVRKLEELCGFITQYTVTWLPALRPWLKCYWNGDPVGSSFDFEAALQRAAQITSSAKE